MQRMFKTTKAIALLNGRSLSNPQPHLHCRALLTHQLGPGLLPLPYMVVEEFRVNLTRDEKDLVSNPERWFCKLPGSAASFIDALESWSKHHIEVIKQRGRAGSAWQQPPLCIFCFDEDSDTNELCGRLRWCPEIPLFFAVHELCALMTPEILTIDNPTPLGKELFETDINQLHRAYVRGRTLQCFCLFAYGHYHALQMPCCVYFASPIPLQKLCEVFFHIYHLKLTCDFDALFCFQICSVCNERGAGIGCCSSACRRVFHLPCAIRSMCFLDYEEYRSVVSVTKEEQVLAVALLPAGAFFIFHVRSAPCAFWIMKSIGIILIAVLMPNRAFQKNKDDLCCLCMDKVEPNIIMHSVIKTDCCGPRFYHFDCML
ncbi:hypothetical protein OSTOST_04897, partial [Ostertagia ostertagi]